MRSGKEPAPIHCSSTMIAEIGWTMSRVVVTVLRRSDLLHRAPKVEARATG